MVHIVGECQNYSSEEGSYFVYVTVEYKIIRTIKTDNYRATQNVFYVQIINNKKLSTLRTI